MKLLVLFLVALIGSAVAIDDDIEWTEDMVNEIFSRSAGDDFLPIPELIAANGYTSEIHKVTTEDGYILEMHRISAAPTSPAADDKPVVFLMHGLLSSSADWVIMGPGKGLGYILADAGYDVWMANGRGNTYCKSHTTITDSSSKEFWYFSWHEIGIYDLPAMIDFILDTTGQAKLIYIGHSQGTTSFFVMASQKPEYNDKIKAMFALAPVGYMGNLKSPLVRMASIAVNTLTTITNLFGMYEFLPSTDLINAAGSTFCHDDALTQVLCSNVLFVICGFNKPQLNATMLPTILRYTPAGASTRQLVHYGQEIRSNKFRLYDHGWIKNMLTYGSLSPPNYDLSLITAPVHLIYSDNDWMAAVKDVQQLYNELRNPIEMRRVLDENWNHLDFLWGIDAKFLVYDNILSTIRESYSD